MYQDAERAFETASAVPSYPVANLGASAHTSEADLGRRLRDGLAAHHRRVGDMSRLLALAIGLTPARSEIIGRAASFHDVGKLFVSRYLFLRSGSLSPSEEREMEAHVLHGEMALSRDPDPASQLAARIALQHHESWDGGGYPYGLKGNEICLEARLVTICDVYDSLRDARLHKATFSHDLAVLIMSQGDEPIRPTMFDPTLLATFLKRHADFRDYWEKFSPPEQDLPGHCGATPIRSHH